MCVCVCVCCHAAWGCGEAMGGGKSGMGRSWFKKENIKARFEEQGEGERRGYAKGEGFIYIDLFSPFREKLSKGRKKIIKGQ